MRKRNARYPHVCKTCKKPFISQKRRQDFCCNACAASGYHATHKVSGSCLYCGKEFVGAPTKKYCCKAHADAHRAIRHYWKDRGKTPTNTPRYGFWGI